MRRALTFSIALAACAFAARAQEGFDPTKVAKSYAIAPSAAPLSPRAKVFEPLPDILSSYGSAEALVPVAQDPRRPRYACDATSNDLCFDMKDRRAVYRGVREYMPKVEGLRPESMSLKRDGIVLKYSFK